MVAHCITNTTITNITITITTCGFPAATVITHTEAGGVLTLVKVW